MKTRTLGLILILFGIPALVFSQDYAFKVLANKGNNEVKNGSTWQPLKTGASLKVGDELKVSENAYLALVHLGSGRPLELKEPKVYDVASLSKKMETGGTTSVVSKYADFILTNSAEGEKNKLSATGAVRRDVAGGVSVALPEEHQSIFGQTVPLRWNSPVQGPFVVTVRNMFDELLAQYETPEKYMEIDLSDPKFGEGPILIQVAPKDDPTLACSARFVQHVESAKKQEVQNALAEAGAFITEETAVSKLYLAGFYETHGLVIDAIAAYEDAIKLAPEVTDYVESYEDFLLRHGIRVKVTN